VASSEIEKRGKAEKCQTLILFTGEKFADIPGNQQYWQKLGRSALLKKVSMFGMFLAQKIEKCYRKAFFFYYIS
jgi:hypothetical protein